MSEEEYDLALVLKTISEPTRFKIVQLLLAKHHCSRSIAKTLSITESAVSQHMSVLKKCGAVTSFRHGYHVHYVLNKEAFEQISKEFERWIGLMDQIQDCHELNPCQFLLGDGTNGCLYKAANSEREGIENETRNS